MRAQAVLLTLCALFAQAQPARKLPPAPNQPFCSAGAICFSGKVSGEETFRKALNPAMDFVLAPGSPGWRITIAPASPVGDCQELAGVVTPPYRAHGPLYIDMSYGWSARDELSFSPRQFRFVTNCADFRAEFERLTTVLWPYSVTPKQREEAGLQLGSSPAGKGRLWITGSKVSDSGKIQWMAFTVELILPRLAQ